MPGGAASYAEVTIANGASLSGVADLTSHRLVGIVIPSAWTAANLTFQGRPKASADVTAHPNDALANVYDQGGAEVTVTVGGASRFIALTPATSALFDGIGELKVRSGTSGAAVNQGAARVITLVLIPIT